MMAGFVHHNLTQPLPEPQRGGVIAIGNFDGVHRGHQVVLHAARRQAEELQKPWYTLSFEPHPRTLFKPQSPVFRLTDENMKARVLCALGADGLLTLPFDKPLAATSAEQFVEDYLLERAGASHIVSGFNFHFGKGREGSPEFMRNAGTRHQFGVTIVEAQTDQFLGEIISSSRIRRLLGNGEVANAAKLLGYHWVVSGEVVKGAQLGRTLGYPTANLVLADNCRLAHGIYAARLRRADGKLFNGVASYGRRPTFDNGPAWLETFVFDFDDDLYGEVVEVGLFAYLRGEEKFDSADALIAQMDADSDHARKIMGEISPISPLDQTLNFDGLQSPEAS